MEWIDAATPPTEDGRYLVYGDATALYEEFYEKIPENAEIYFFDVRSYYVQSDKWHWGSSPNKVTHWMPLPEPPKGA